jgi:excisionase family DNA binding protein
MTAESQESLTSIEEASRRLCVSTFTTRRLIKARQLRGVRVGRRVLIPASELARAMHEGCGAYAGGTDAREPQR